MINLNENQNSGTKKISWIQIVNAVVQAIIAALTALGVSSCASAINSL
ncbi:MAG: smalltalk protein [Segatella copri]